MDDKNRKSGFENQKAHVGEAASDLYHEGRKLVNELYEDGREKYNEAHAYVKEYSDDLADKVRRNPIGSVLIAAGVGFLLSSILKK